MKKLLLFSLACCIIFQSFATSISKPVKVYASDVLFAIGNTHVSLEKIATMKVSDYEMLTSKHMSLAEKVGFKIAQRKLRHGINADGSINNKKMADTFRKAMDGDSGFNLGGFALGLILGIIGVLIAYLISDEKKKARTKWAWIGFGAAIVLYILFLVI